MYLDALPFPDLSLIKGNEKIGITPLATSRGCPFDCSFCSVTRMFGRGYRFRSVDNVMEELKELSPEKVFFYDDNFTANRGHTKELLDKMLTTGIAPKWTAQVRAEITKDKELLKMMRRSNCYFVYVGIESVNPETLKEYDKRQVVEEIVESIRILHEHKIMIHGMFVLGAEKDTVRTVQQTVNFALKNKIDTVQIMSLTPLPGTPVLSKMESEDRLLTKDWSLYDGQHVVYRPNSMSPYEMQKAVILASKKFYSIYQCTKAIINPDSLAFLSNLLIGRWHEAKSHARMRALGWFYRAYGHVLTKRFDAANKDFSEMIKNLSEGAVSNL
jgi:radical SAM superfamily enzyme YgiQ (UPF0313 family)